MNKILTIAFTEYANAVRSKAFIIGLLAMPLMMGLMIAVPHFTRDKMDVSDRKVAIVDFSNELLEVIQARGERRNANNIFQTDALGEQKQTQPRFLIEGVDSSLRSWEEHVVELSDRVRKGDLFAFVLIGENVFDVNSSGKGIAYHTRTPTFQQLLRLN